MTPTIQLGEVTVYLFTTRDERPSNRRHKTPKSISLYKTLHSRNTFQNIDVQ